MAADLTCEREVRAATVELERVAHGVFVATHPFCFTTTTVVLGEEDGCWLWIPE